MGATRAAALLLQGLLLAAAGALRGAAAAAGASPPPASGAQWFEQAVDHFDLLDLRLWKQRYWAGRLDHFKVGGPIFFVPGGEAPMESLLYRSFGERLARTFGGVHYALEHRFYGASMPLGSAEASFARSPAALGKLTVEQAVADAAAFLRFLKREVHPSAGKVIAFGGSYAGKLAAYLRYSHPHVCDGALAASAPVLLDGFGMGVAQYAYYERVTAAAELRFPGCAAATRAAFQTLLSTPAQELERAIPLCGPLGGEAGRDEVVMLARIAFANAGMSNYPPLPRNGTEMFRLCSALAREQGLQAWSAFFLPQRDKQAQCLDMRDQVASVRGRLGSVKCGDLSGCGTGWAGEAWDYQSSTQVIQPIGTNNITDMFPPLQFSQAWTAEHNKATFAGAVCDPFGLQERFGLHDFKTAYTNVIWSNGALDPWAVGGVTDAPLSLMIEDGAHHSDLSEPSDHDSMAVLKAREREIVMVSDILGQRTALRQHARANQQDEEQDLM